MTAMRISGATFAEPEDLSPAQRVDELVALERQLACIQARQCRVLAAMEADPCRDVPAPELDKRWVREDVRAALGESAVGAEARLCRATMLVRELPATLGRLRDGDISFRQASYLCEQVMTCDPKTVRDVEAEVLATVVAGAPLRTMVTFRRRVRRAVLAADLGAARARRDVAERERCVGITADADGVVGLWGSLPDRRRRAGRRRAGSSGTRGGPGHPGRWAHPRPATRRCPGGDGASGARPGALVLRARGCRTAGGATADRPGDGGAVHAAGPRRPARRARRVRADRRRARPTHRRRSARNVASPGHRPGRPAGRRRPVPVPPARPPTSTGMFAPTMSSASSRPAIAARRDANSTM